MKTPKIFLSYSRDDSEFAQNLAVKLREAGATLWIDQLDIAAGARWDIEVGKALETSECLLVILSQTSVESNNVLDEVSYALDSNRRVVPIVIDDCNIPFRLRRLQYVDFSKNFDNAFERLISSLNEEKSNSLKANLAALERTEPIKPVRNSVLPEQEDDVQFGEKSSASTSKAKNSNTAKNIVIVILVLAIGGLVYYLKTDSDKEKKSALINDNTKTATINTDTTAAVNSSSNRDMTTVKDTIPKVIETKPVVIKDPIQTVPRPLPLIITKGQFSFNTRNDARERGEVMVTISQSGKTVWKERIPAQGPWAASTKYSFDMSVNAEVSQSSPLSIRLSLCSPRGRDISWTCEALAVLYQSNNTKKTFKGVFTLNTSGGNGIPKCDEVAMNRVMPEISVKASGVKALKSQ
jgi:hypothetical protein